MRILVINLPRSEKRLTQLAAKMSRDDCPFEIVRAVDGRLSSPDEFPSYSPASAFKHFGRTLVGGEIGCFLSHRKCLEEFLSGSDDMCLVLEDDVDWQVGTKAKLSDLESLLQGLGDEWHAVNAGHATKRISMFGGVDRLKSGEEVGWAFDFPMAAHALIWSRRGAEFFLNSSTLIKEPVDVATRRIFSENGLGLGVLPPLILQTNEDSDIQDGTQNPGRSAVELLQAQWSRFRRRGIRGRGLKSARRCYQNWCNGQK